MKKYLLFPVFFLVFAGANAQFLKKLKQKAEQAVTKKVEKAFENKNSGDIQVDNTNDKAAATEEKASTGTNNLKVYSKFDFVPGSTILYFDNFEKDNIGETPLGWITSNSAEVVTIDGLEGNWLKMSSTSAQHITRNKKQSWGNNFTIEFDLLIVKNNYDPRIDINLINTGGNLVTDENILRNDKKPAINFSAIVGGNNKSRASLYAFDKKLSDVMVESLPYGNAVPVHVSMSVQGKRFRMWWNDRKLYDLAAVSEEYVPNQLQFAFGSVGGSEFYISNLRVAKDIPDTRAKFEEGKLISNLLFYTGTAKLKPESMGALLDVSKILKEATTPVKIVGHTDSNGDDAANLKLSQQRADAVREILMSQYNIDENKLTTEGQGESQPIADNTSYEGKAQNRRVEFIFKPGADKYIPPAGTSKSSISTNKPKAASPALSSSGAATVALQSKILTINLPYAQFMKTGESSYTFIASIEEGNSKENYVKIELRSINLSFKPEIFNFEENNRKNPLYGTKKFAEIRKTEAILHYGAAQKPYIYQFSPVVANGHMATFYTESLSQKLPPASPNCKFVIEKVEDGKASGYFISGIVVEGLKPITKGDGMQQTFTTGFSGEMKFTFNNVPVY
jgi:outer membrane protein OmpA-like peptidoglycan-associated protein